jgi:hypothetical protein
MTDFATAAYRIMPDPPGVMRGALAAGTTVGMSISPNLHEQSSIGDPYYGNSVDLSIGGGMAFLMFGMHTNSTPMLVFAQQSNDGVTWASITGASVLVGVTDYVGYVNFHRSQRYVRAAIEHQDQSPTQSRICAIVGRQ